MSFQITCDYCGKAIDGHRYATVNFGGYWENDRLTRIADAERHYHSGTTYEKDQSCYVRAFELVQRAAAPESLALQGIPVMDDRERRRLERARRWREGTPLHKLGLGEALARNFEDVDVYTVEELTQLTEDEALQVEGVGPKRLDEIKAALSARGLVLRDRPLPAVTT